MSRQREQYELLARLLECSPEPMAASRSGRLVFANPAFARLVGAISAEALPGQTLEGFLPGYRELAEIATRSHAPQLSPFPPRYPCLVLTRAGHTLAATATVDTSGWEADEFLQISLAPAPEAACAQACAVAEELRAHNERLEKVMEERTAELMAANHELESFAYSVSHDLRAPLRAINGFSKMLREHCGAALDETSAGYLDRVLGATLRMSALIDDLLRLSQVTRAEMRHEAVDLSMLMRPVLSRLQEERPLHTEIQPGMRVRGDAPLLKVMLINLLENAWKFTSREAAPTVAVSAVRKGRWLECHVRDNGIGFDPAFADRLFQPFQRLHSQQDFPGTGIGLATVRRVVERHGGRIWAHASPGDGASFFFTLPCA